MDALTVLKRLRGADEEIERLKARIKQRRDLLTAKSAGVGDPNGGSRGGGDRDKTGALLADIDALERALQLRTDEKNAEEMSALALLDMAPDLESEVLYLYYVQRMTTGGIAQSKRYQPAYVRRVKRNGETMIAMLSEELVDATLPKWYLQERG